jgi:hypothetical protein
VWCVVCGVWCVVCGVWCVVCGVWCVVCGVWCVVCGVWCVVCVMCFVVLSLRSSAVQSQKGNRHPRTTPKIALFNFIFVPKTPMHACKQ